MINGSGIQVSVGVKLRIGLEIQVSGSHKFQGHSYLKCASGTGMVAVHLVSLTGSSYNLLVSLCLNILLCF